MFDKNNKNKGQVLVLVALSLVVFIGFAALAIDVAYFYHTKHQLQGAADAAALAGAAKLLKDETDLNQPLARSEAVLFANNNIAANSTVILEDGGLGDNILSETNDITVGYWDGSTYYPGQTPVTAVQARARRTGESPGGAISTLFGKIFGVDTVNISATACAARFKAETFPIVVNEYWMATDPFGQRPYQDDQLYPNSFVRKTNVDGTESAVFGKVFGILGTNANSNAMGGKNANSYVNLDVRSSQHGGLGESWYEVDADNPDAVDCSTPGDCESAFKSPTPTDFKPGWVNNAKFDESLRYLHEGYPEDLPLPTAIKEKFIAPGIYPDQADTIYPNPTSDCPFATIAYFSSSGNALTKTYNGKSWYERFPKGKKIVVLVYDGTYPPNASDPNAITIVGYALAQIDGYASSAPKGLDFNNLGTSGNTAYAHALMPIVEPTSAPGDPGICDNNYPKGIKDLMIAGATYRLVQ